MMMALAEFNTAVRFGLDLVVVVLNDNAYGNEIYKYMLSGLSPELAMLGSPDFAPIAEAFGARGISVRSDEQFDEAMREIETAEQRPVLLDVRLDGIGLSAALIGRG